MADPFWPAEQKDMVTAAIHAYHAAEKASRDADAEDSGGDPDDDPENAISHLRVGFLGEKYMEATRDLILAIKEAIYSFPAAGIFHDGWLYLIYLDEAREHDKDEDGHWTEWVVTKERAAGAGELTYDDDFVYRLMVIPRDSMVNFGAGPLIFP